MKVTITDTIELTPRELTDELWNMDSDEQAEVLSNIADIHKSGSFSLLMQFEYIAESVKTLYGDDVARDIAMVLGELVERLKGGDTE